MFCSVWSFGVAPATSCEPYGHRVAWAGTKRKRLGDSCEPPSRSVSGVRSAGYFLRDFLAFLLLFFLEDFFLEVFLAFLESPFSMAAWAAAKRATGTR